MSILLDADFSRLQHTLDRSYKQLAEAEKGRAELEHRLANTATSLELTMHEQLGSERMRLEAEHRALQDRFLGEVWLPLASCQRPTP
jgi:hypothetical protein